MTFFSMGVVICVKLCILLLSLDIITEYRFNLIKVVIA